MGCWVLFFPLALVGMFVSRVASIPRAKEKDLPGWQGEVHHVDPSAYPKKSPIINIPTIAAQHNHPALKSEMLIMAAKRPKPSHHASTVVELGDGSFMASWFGGEFEGKPDVGIWVSRWRRGEDAWSTPVEVVKPRGGIPTWNPVLFKRPSTGELLLFYKVGKHPPAWKGYVLRSSDDGATWSEPQALGQGIVGPAKNKPIELMDGTIISGTSDEGGKDGKYWTAWVEESKDGGHTWTRIGPIELDGRVIQPAPYLDGNGNVRMVMRTRSRYMAISKGDQHGHGWSPAKLTELPCPNSGLDAVTLQDGRVLLVYNHSFKKGLAGRSVLAVAVSSNDGESWKRVLTLEDTGGRVVEFSYPAVIQTAAGDVLISYTWGRENIKTVMIDPSKL